MEKLKMRHMVVVQVLKTLDESLQLFNKSEKESSLWWSLSDSVIQRFEYSIDTFWKYLKLYLEEKGMVQETTGSPKNVLRFAVEADCITKDEYDILHDAISDRNETSHSYDHEVAREIVQSIPAYYATMKVVTERLQP
jgi:nucleotidyltransferase substrate binding protein (TIGR01987 family)